MQFVWRFHKTKKRKQAKLGDDSDEKPEPYLIY